MHRNIGGTGIFYYCVYTLNEGNASSIQELAHEREKIVR